VLHLLEGARIPTQGAVVVDAGGKSSLLTAGTLEYFQVCVREASFLTAQPLKNRSITA